jgi:hypothetical protein
MVEAKEDAICSWFWNGLLPRVFSFFLPERWFRVREENMARRLKKIPEFRSREEEFDFWATHDSSAYQMEEQEEGSGPPSVKITYRKTRRAKALKAHRR